MKETSIVSDKVHLGNWIEDKNIKSKMIIGNLIIMQTKKFNWFNKLMYKIAFGIKIEEIKNTNSLGGKK